MYFKGISFTVRRQNYSLGVAVHDANALDNDGRDTIGLKDLNHFPPVYRVKGFLEVDEGDDALKIFVFDTLNQSSERQNMSGC